MKKSASNTYLQSYLDCVAELEAVTAGLDESSLDLNKGEGWTIREIIHHIVDGDDIWSTYVKLALGNPEAIFHLDWYWQIPQDSWARFWAYQQRDVQGSLALFRANREHIASILRHVPDGLDRSAHILWPEQTEATQISVAYVVEMQTRHVKGHIDDIRAICQLHNR